MSLAQSHIQSVTNRCLLFAVLCWRLAGRELSHNTKSTDVITIAVPDVTSLKRVVNKSSIDRFSSRVAARIARRSQGIQS